MRFALILALPAIIYAQQPKDITGYRDIPWGSTVEAFKVVVPVRYDGHEHSAKATSGMNSLTIVPRFGYKGLDRVVVRVDGLSSFRMQDEALQSMEGSLLEKYGEPTVRGTGGNGTTWRTKTTTIKLTSMGVSGIYVATVTYLPSASPDASTSQAL